MYKNLHTYTTSVFTFYLNPILGEQNEIIMMLESRIISLYSFLFSHSDGGPLLCLMNSCNLTVPHSIFKLLCPRCFSLMTLSTQTEWQQLAQEKGIQNIMNGSPQKKRHVLLRRYGYIAVASVHVFKESQINIFPLVEQKQKTIKNSQLLHLLSLVVHLINNEKHNWNFCSNI